MAKVTKKPHLFSMVVVMEEKVIFYLRMHIWNINTYAHREILSQVD